MEDERQEKTVFIPALTNILQLVNACPKTRSPSHHSISISHLPLSLLALAYLMTFWLRCFGAWSTIGRPRISDRTCTCAAADRGRRNSSCSTCRWYSRITLLSTPHPPTHTHSLLWSIKFNG